MSAPFDHHASRFPVNSLFPRLTPERGRNSEEGSHSIGVHKVQCTVVVDRSVSLHTVALIRKGTAVAEILSGTSAGVMQQ